MLEDAVQVLKNSSDLEELQRAATTLASSDNTTSQQELYSSLTNKEFLTRLDTEKDYDGPARRLRLAAVVKALVDNKSPSARQTMIGLSQSQAFLQHPARADLLIDAWALVVSPPPEAIKFWDDHCQPEDGYAHRTVRRLADNGSDQALQLLEKKLGDPRHDSQGKIEWLRRHVIRHRANLVMLAGCQRLLQGPLPLELRAVLVEALFDYQPKLWYGSDNWPRIPDRSTASRESLRKLQEIGRYALKDVQLTEAQRKVVETALEGIDVQIGKP